MRQLRNFILRGGQHRCESSAETETCEHAGVTEGKHPRGQRTPGSGQVCGEWPSQPLPDPCEQRAAAAAVAERCRPLWMLLSAAGWAPAAQQEAPASVPGLDVYTVISLQAVIL